MRRAFVPVLLVLTGVLLFVGGLGLWAHSNDLRQLHVRRRATSILDSQAVRKEVAERLTTELVRAGNQQAISFRPALRGGHRGGPRHRHGPQHLPQRHPHRPRRRAARRFRELGHQPLGLDLGDHEHAAAAVRRRVVSRSRRAASLPRSPTRPSGWRRSACGASSRPSRSSATPASPVPSSRRGGRHRAGRRPKTGGLVARLGARRRRRLRGRPAVGRPVVHRHAVLRPRACRRGVRRRQRHDRRPAHPGPVDDRLRRRDRRRGGRRRPVATRPPWSPVASDGGWTTAGRRAGERCSSACSGCCSACSSSRTSTSPRSCWRSSRVCG